MAFVVRISDRELRVPKRATTSGVIGDGVVTITPEDSEWQAWQDAIRENRVLVISPDEVEEED